MNLTHCMNKFVAVTTAVVGIASVASASEYIWNGGSSGAWNTASNWKIVDGEDEIEATTIPGAGDTANFTDTTEITDAFEIGEGTLTVLRNADVTFDGIISGAGKLSLTGAGCAHLKGANTFAGGLSAVGTASSKRDGTGSVKVYNAKALGAGKAVIDPTTGPVLTVMSGVTELDTELQFKSTSGIEGVIVMPTDVTTFTFNKDVVWDGKSELRGKSDAVYNFMGKCMNGNYTFGTWGKSHFYGQTQIAYWAAGATEFHFHTDKIEAIQFHVSFPVYCYVENAFPHSFRWFAFSSNSAKIDLGGCNQYINDINGWHVDGQRGEYCIEQYKMTNHSITSTDNAILTLSLKNPSATPVGCDNPYVTEVWRGKITGKAGLCWNPVDSRSSFTISNSTQSTTGELHVSNGLVRVSTNAKMSSLSKLVVGPTGQFEVCADASEVGADLLEIADGAVVTLGKEIVVRAAYVNGTKLNDGEYTAESGYFTGSGKLVVSSHLINTWKGPTSGGYWNTDSNWTLEHKPAADEKAVVPSGTTLTLSESTAELYDLTVEAGARINVTGWETKIAATHKVTVAGTISAAAAMTSTVTEPNQRIWIECGELVIPEGGALDMTGRGWAAYGGPGSNNNDMGGASHGGFGSLRVVATDKDVKYAGPYDDAFAPTLPGSGGQKGGTSGGGAILIEATGKVTVNGQILANADNSPGLTATKPADKYCGSGGSIWITCASLEGSGGQIEANGGDGDVALWPFSYAVADPSSRMSRAGCCGGGGMIRIEYGAGQGSATLENMVISAAGGVHRGYVGCPDYLVLTTATEDRWRTEADLGTLTFTDLTLVRQMLGHGLSGRLVDVDSYTHEGNLNWTAGHVRFAKEGADVEITGNLNISGAESRCEIGGVMTRTNVWIYADRWGGDKFNKLTVGKNLTITGGAALDIRAGEAEKAADGTQWGGEVEVGGNMTVGSGAWVYPWSDIINLANVHFTVGGNFTVEAGGTISADWRGARGGTGSCAYMQQYFRDSLGVAIPSGGLGAGAGNNGYAASYGGKGGSYYSEISDNSAGPFFTTGYANLYGNRYEPIACGSGAGAGGYAAGSDGGGLVYVKAQGAVTVNGTITAEGRIPQSNALGNANNFSEYYSYCKQGAGSGGAIYLYGDTFAGTGVIKARGGNALSGKLNGGGSLSGTTLSYSTAAGGGGRIAIAVGAQCKAAGRSKMKQYEGASSIASGYTFTGTLDVSGGTNIWYISSYNCAVPTEAAPQYDKAQGNAGTLGFTVYEPKSGAVIIMR